MTTPAIHCDARLYQFTVENQVLQHVKAALRKTLASNEQRMGLVRKVSTVQFVTESLIRHLRRLLEIEDEVEVDPAEEGKPHLSEKATQLQREHREFHAYLDRLSDEVAHLSPYDEPRFNAFCGELLGFLDRLDRHEKAELDMLHQLHNSDEGGEG
jgi:hypothetical protein